MFRTAWFYVVMIPLIVTLGLINEHAALGPDMLAAGGGLCAAIAARIADRSLLELKTLLMMLAGSVVGILLFQSWESGIVFCEFIFWWGVFGIPLRMTLPSINESKG